MELDCAGQIVLIPVEQIVPNIRQPRKHFGTAELESLSQSIKQNGIIQPITVRSAENGTFEIIAGERRFRSCIMAGIENIPCIIIESSDEKVAVLALTENIQRQNLTFFEEADAINSLITTYSYSSENVARMLGKSPSAVSNKLRLLKLSPEIRKRIISSNLTERHARALLRLENEKDINKALNSIITKKLNVAQSDELIDRMINIKIQKNSKKPVRLFKDIKIFINTIEHAIDVMKTSGIPANSEKTENEEFIEYTVRIPKNNLTVIKSRRNS